MAQTAQQRAFEIVENEAQRVFVLQREAYRRHPYPSVAEPGDPLSKLERILVDNVDAIADAVNRDFGNRCAEETKLLEIFTSVDGIRDARRRVGRWMRPQRRHVSILFATGKNSVGARDVQPAIHEDAHTTLRVAVPLQAVGPDFDTVPEAGQYDTTSSKWTPSSWRSRSGASGTSRKA